MRSIDILLVEDNPSDGRLTLEGFRDGRLANRITVGDQGKALAILRLEPPNEGTRVPRDGPVV